MQTLGRDLQQPLEFGQADRLDQVPVKAGLSGPPLVLFLPIARNRNQSRPRRRRILSERGRDAIAIEPREST